MERPSQAEDGWPKLVGVKCLECNFNSRTKTYNPHLHIIVPDVATAEILIAEWLKKWTWKFTRRAAQHMRKVKDIENDLIELIKYGSKVFAEPGKDTRGNILPPKVYAAAYETIFNAMKPYRIFERFGFNLPKKTPKQKGPEFLSQYDEWVFNPAVNDWHNVATGALLTGYLPTPQLRYLLGEGVDTDLR